MRVKQSGQAGMAAAGKGAPPEPPLPNPVRYEASAFRESAYLQAYPDVREAVQRQLLPSGWAHYLAHGAREIASGERAPFAPTEPWRLGPLYLASNPDIGMGVETGVIASALSHWEQHGRQEEASGIRPSLPQDRFYPAGKLPARDWAATAGRFDAAGYLLRNPDLSTVLGENPEAARAHWLERGRDEGRSGPGVAPFAGRRATFRAVLGRPPGIDLHGPLAAADSDGTTARNLWHALIAAGIPVDLHAFDTSHGTPRVPVPVRVRPGGHRVNLIVADPACASALALAHAPDRFDDAYNIGFWPAEMAAPDPAWQPAFGLVDEIWTASAFARDAIGAVSPVPVQCIGVPMPVPPASTEDLRDAFGLRPQAFVFLMSFAAENSQRRNPLAAIRAFRAAFSGREDVLLVVKYRVSAANPGLARALADASRGLRNVVVIAERLTESEMSGLLDCADCMVSPHRSTAFGIGLAEVMLRGKPVIATDYGGSRDLLDDTTGFPVACEMVEREGAPEGWAGAIWASPDEAGLAAQMRAVEQDRAAALRIGAAGARHVRTVFGLEAVGARIAARLATLGLNPPTPLFAGGLARSRNSAIPTVLAHLSPASRAALGGTGGRTLLSVLVPLGPSAPALLDGTITTLRGQLYPAWELCALANSDTPVETLALLAAWRGIEPRLLLFRQAAGASSCVRMAAEAARGAYMLLLAPGVALPSAALLALSRVLDADPELDALVPEPGDSPDAGSMLSPERLRAEARMPGPIVIRRQLLLRREPENGARADLAPDAEALRFFLADIGARVRRLPAEVLPEGSATPEPPAPQV